MAVNPADMDSCNIKNTCVGGVNDGVAYDPGSPCGGAANVAFNPVSCDCEETVFCSNGDCGWDVEYEITSANVLHSMKPCGASSCSIICASDTYRVCSTYQESSGSFYLAPGKCIREVRQETKGPCDGRGESAPGGAFLREDWYLCNPDVVDPSYATCSTPIAQMPGGGYCSTVITGPGIEEVGRVQRVKLATQTLTTGTVVSGGQASCGNCQPPDSANPMAAYRNWGAPMELSFGQVHYSNISPACEGGSEPGTWKSEIGADWVYWGTNLLSGSSQAYTGISDALLITGTVGKTAGVFTKGETVAAVVASSWSGAVGCSYNAHSIDSTDVTQFACYKPSELV